MRPRCPGRRATSGPSPNRSQISLNKNSRVASVPTESPARAVTSSESSFPRAGGAFCAIASAACHAVSLSGLKMLAAQRSVFQAASTNETMHRKAASHARCPRPTARRRTLHPRPHDQNLSSPSRIGSQNSRARLGRGARQELHSVLRDARLSTKSNLVGTVNTSVVTRARS